MFNRRKALQLIGATGAALSAVFSLRLLPFGRPAKEQAAGPWAAARAASSWGIGSYGWKLEPLSPVQDGAVVLELRRPASFFAATDGAGFSHRYQVHICVYDDQPCGIAHTLFVRSVLDGWSYR